MSKHQYSPNTNRPLYTEKQSLQYAYGQLNHNRNSQDININADYRQNTNIQTYKYSQNIGI